MHTPSPCIGGTNSPCPPLLHGLPGPQRLGLSPIADVDLGALEELRVSYSVPDHAPPAAAPGQLPMWPPALTPEPIEVNSSSEEDDAISLLLRIYLTLLGLSSSIDPLVASILTWVARHRPCLPLGRTSAPSPLDVALKPQGMGIDAPTCVEGNLQSASPFSTLGQSQSPLPTTYQVPGWRWFGYSIDSFFGPLSTLEPQPRVDPCLHLGVLYLLRRGWGRPSPPRPSESLRSSERTPPPPSSTAHNHAVLISCFSAMGDKGVVLQPYKGLLSFYDEASGSSSWADQLEGELKAVKREKAREEGILQCRLKN
ncbi:hypothetical protein LIER_42026 [Lithospermum erythrorhizon]|uniref:Uncharacterized protein n=1 Tax=Lithospermum erythrorhizon TaxID=34254 RepID=A0AAV3RLX4_LITER